MVEHIKEQCASIASADQNLMMIGEMKGELIQKTNILLDEIRKGPFGLHLVDFEHVIPLKDKFKVKT